MNIILATVADSEVLTALDASRPFSAHWNLAGWQSELVQPTSRVWCAQEEGKIVGFIVLRGVAGQYELLNLAVAAERTRSGIGSALVDYALRVLAQQGAGQISLEVSTSNPAAQQLYRKMGFEVVGIRKQFYHDGADGLIMEKNYEIRA